MERTWVAFDVDGTLIDSEDMPKLDVIQLLRQFHMLGCLVIVWSGGGREYAEHWVQKLDLEDCVWDTASKTEYKRLPIDIAVDDAVVNLGKVNIFVGELMDNPLQEEWGK
jgi:phosphoserine phosphatase